ncbi:hypothetical protein, partial [Xanthomonas translucens]|uniref:hypothetical protein n=1 Tax=Xanthomonas campestris pv. translucens TaxID=343 RepID=UPI0021B7ABB4
MQGVAWMVRQGGVAGARRQQFGICQPRRIGLGQRLRAAQDRLVAVRIVGMELLAQLLALQAQCARVVELAQLLRIAYRL